MKKLLLIICIVSLLLPTVYALSASMGNAKAILRVNASPEDPAIIERTILVNNKNDIPIIINITPTKDFEKFVYIKDNGFIMQPGESRKARFTLTIDRGGKIEGRLNVAFIPADPEARDSMVGLAASIIILSDGPIIEDPEEEFGNEPLATGNQLNELNESEDYTDLESGQKEDNETVDTTVTDPSDNDDESLNIQDHAKIESPSLFAGFFIIAIMLGIGVGLFFIIKKIRK